MIRLLRQSNIRRSRLLLALVAVLAFAAVHTSAADAGSTNGSVGIIVRLSDPPVSRYAGTAGFARTSTDGTGTRLDPRSPAVRSYRARLAARQDAFVASARTMVPEVQLLHRYQMVLGGVALRVPETAVDAIAALPGVVAVYRDSLLHLATEASPTFIGAKGAWKDLGGQESAGEGVIVGVLDTGIWPEHPSLSDPDPTGNAYAPLGVFPACQFGTGANPGPPFTCNNKLIGAYRFMAGYDACVTAGNCAFPAGTFTSARDEDGHGTHTATTAAGNGQLPATVLGVERGNVSGIAPRARVIAYKVCGASGCLDSDCAAAVDQAISDGVDVINFSVEGGLAPYSDPVELAFFDAYASGVFVAASAGNSGPDAETVEHRGPWVTTVAASTQKRFFASTLKLASSDGAKLTVKGSTITAGIDPPAALVDAATLGDPFCTNGTPDAALFGKVVLCERGVNQRLAKSFNVAQRGGVGMVLYNPDLQGFTTDNHRIPTISLENDAGAAVKTFLTLHPDVEASFTAGKAKRGAGDRVASFSSRGGPLQLLGVNKPDITAPGVLILAGNSPATTTPTDADNELFQVILGTSMSSPHVAGAAALVRALHPTFTPGQIKSTLMTLASGKVFDADGAPFDPFDAGAGRLALKKLADVPITFDAQPFEFEAVSHLWDVNLPSLYVPNVASTITVTRTAHSVRDTSTTLKLKVAAPDDLVVTVPAEITVPAGGDTAFPIQVDVSAVPEGQVRHATILFSGGGPKLRFPVTVRKISGTATLYAGNGGGAFFAPGGIFRVDQAFGSASFLGDPVTPGGLTGIAFTSDGSLYGATNEGGVSRLVRINPDTGALIGYVGAITDDDFFGFAIAIADLAAQPGTGLLYGVRWNGDGQGLAGYIYAINPTTAFATLVGSTGTCAEGGLAFAPDGTLYFTGAASCGSATRALHVLNPATAAIVSSIPLGGFYDGLTVRPTDGALFASSAFAATGDDSLFVIDPATGVEVFWGRSGTGTLADLAFRAQ